MNRTDAMELNPLIADIADGGADTTFESIIGAFGMISTTFKSAVSAGSNNMDVADWHKCLCQAADVSIPLLRMCRGALSYEYAQLFAGLGVATDTSEGREQAAQLNPLICHSSRLQTFKNITASITNMAYLLEDACCQDEDTAQPGTSIAAVLTLIESCSAAVWFECCALRAVEGKQC